MYEPYFAGTVNATGRDNNETSLGASVSLTRYFLDESIRQFADITREENVDFHIKINVKNTGNVFDQ